MPDPQRLLAIREPGAEFRLLGRVPFDAFLGLQSRLVYEAGGMDEPRIVVLLCEHPDLITVGRAGSRGHVRFSNDQLKHEQLAIRWISRGGGCILHAPGQLAVYPIVPLGLLGWTVGEYLRRLQRGIVDGFAELNVRGETCAGSFGVWGRSGLLANVGVAVRSGIACHGAFINVNPAMRRYAFVDVFPPPPDPDSGKSVMGCLLALARWGSCLLPGFPVAALAPQLLPLAYQTTTTLSANLIECACQGQADERLLLALDGILCAASPPSACAAALSAWGNTSGRDALVGMALVILG